jgi:hypothetical protein
VVPRPGHRLNCPAGCIRVIGGPVELLINSGGSRPVVFLEGSFDDVAMQL